MAHPSFDHARADFAPMEVRIDRDGPGPRRWRWRWSLWRDDALIARSPAAFAGAEEAYQAGRMALLQPRPVPLPPTAASRQR
ncbi:hypothetical protein [Roseomonas indoligenes]|uniref:Uncharacterized protein n=1 Tax=Roseomonas indoligenes TaxID=2820811 RepID=A0A940N605_9PROT|nr:hypothetical protein [Pararoseomonas indoligenes]MBP0495740.1 hypothetical protein [Pararoseomonas indoligenes]